ncbi:MAG: hypothetical protein HY703_07970 [Gemmatimonadetes bacterium]|nr:hypothetical protein [Gemmatimonadota bacterium]
MPRPRSRPRPGAILAEMMVRGDSAQVARASRLLLIGAVFTGGGLLLGADTVSVLLE